MPAESTWIDACACFLRDRGVDEGVAAVLAAFASPQPRGGPPPAPEDRWSGRFEALERELLREPIAIAADLAEEVDAGQASMFERRTIAVDRALAELDDPVGRVLRVGLRKRLAGIAAASRPRATRVRALADFYYSQAGRHLHRRRGEPGVSTRERAVDLRWRPVADGLEHACLAGPGEDGPLHVNLLRADPRRVALSAFDAREGGAPFAELVAGRGGIAAVSGGFFLYSEPDIAPPSARYDPVGLLVEEGRVRSPPVFARAALVVDDAGTVAIGRIGLRGQCMRFGGREHTVESVLHRAHARVGPDCPSVAVVGDVVVARGRALAVPLNGFVSTDGPLCELGVGERVEWGPVRAPAGAAVRSGIAGGPLLLEDGAPAIDLRAEDFWGSAPPVTFSQDETGDMNLLPRLGAGIDAQARVVLAAVDGRNFERALGMTLGELAQLFAALGCRTALNLDGGSSKRMVLDGRTLDLSSTEVVSGVPDEVAVRPVHTALLLRSSG